VGRGFTPPQSDLTAWNKKFLLFRKQACQYKLYILSITKELAPHIGVCIGSGVGGLITLHEQFAVLHEKGPSRVSPFLVPMMINAAPGMVSLLTGAQCDLDYVSHQASQSKVRVALSNSMGFGGHNTYLTFKQYEQ
jgi:3-oxoacyl-(acyl-carrier-protein) synthase